MKKLLSLSMCVVLVVLLLAGCSGKSDGSASGGASAGTAGSDKITLTFFHRWPNEPFKSYFDGIIKEFEQKNPNIKINVITALNEEYKQKINVQLSNSNPPDIFFTWVGEYGDKFIRNGTALDLTKYVQEDKAWADQIIPSALKPFTLDNKVYGVPILMDVRQLTYNKEIFNKLGLEPPTTWQQFVEVLGKIKASGITPLGLGNKAPWNAGLYITTLNQRLVGKEALAKDNNRATGEFTDPGYIQALQKLQELMPYMNDQPNALSREEERNMFVNGKIAIMPLHTIEYPFVKNAKFDWGTFNFPSIEGAPGDQNVITGAPEGFMISAKSKHPAEAMAFLKYLTSQPQAERWVKQTSVISTTKGAVTTENSLPVMVQVIKQVEASNDMAIWIDTMLDGQIVNPYLAGLQELLNKTKTPEQIMSDVQAAAKRVREASK